MFRSVQNKTTKKRQPDFIDLNAMVSSVDAESFDRRKYRMGPRSSGSAGDGAKTARFICVVDPRKTNVRRVSGQFQRDGVKIAHCLEFINTLVVLGDPATVRTCAEQISGIKCLVIERAGRKRWLVGRTPEQADALDAPAATVRAFGQLDDGLNG